MDSVIEFLRGLSADQRGWLVLGLLILVTWVSWRLLLAPRHSHPEDEGLVLYLDSPPEKVIYRQNVTHRDVTEALLMIRDPRLADKHEVIVNAYSIIESGAYIFASLLSGDYRIVGHDFISDEVENETAEHAFCLTHGQLAFNEDSCLFPYWRAYHVGFGGRHKRLADHQSECVLERVVLALPGTVAEYEPELALSQEA